MASGNNIYMEMIIWDIITASSLTEDHHEFMGTMKKPRLRDLEEIEEARSSNTDTTKLGAAVDKSLSIENLIKHNENDNLRLLQQQKQRIDRY